jgi:hypothetical protein
MDEDIARFYRGGRGGGGREVPFFQEFIVSLSKSCRKKEFEECVEDALKLYFLQ